MKSNIFIPKKINVGFQNRADTYTKKLAYVIYFDEKGTLRKEKSWNSWRDESIDNVVFDNVPTSGFVLNKKVGDYSSGWNHRSSYIRVYDPRDFEFEITVENLLYILENSTSTKGKGLEGEFVYGWLGKDLILIPVESPDYKELMKYSSIILENKTIKAKDLIIGATYMTKDNKQWTYMGKFNKYGYSGKNEGEMFWFYDRNESSYSPFEVIRTIPKNKLINVIDDKCCSDYADLFDKLECYYHYSPIDYSKDEYEYYTLEYFEETVEKTLTDGYWWADLKIYCDLNDEVKTLVTIKRKWEDDGSSILKATKISTKIEKYSYSYSWSYGKECEREVEYNEIIIESENLKELFNKLKPQYKNIYLENGRLNGGVKNNE